MEHRQYTNLNQNANKNMSTTETVKNMSPTVPVKNMGLTVSVETELLPIVGKSIENNPTQILTKAQKLMPIIERLAKNCAFMPKYGEKIVVKPNLLAVTNSLCCTNPVLIVAACLWLKEHGVNPVVADSPGFGSAEKVLNMLGVVPVLQKIEVPFFSLKRPVLVDLASGKQIRLSADALEADALINLPKVKVHKQMRLSFAVKNLFGCIPSVRKALAHVAHGDKGTEFPELIMDIAHAVPVRLSIIDGLIAMHRTGPIEGDPLALGFLAASQNAVALDTFLYSSLGQKPEFLPLWQEAQKRNLLASFVKNLQFSPAVPETFSMEGFEMPKDLMCQSFKPTTLVKSLWKRLRLEYGRG